VDGINPGDSIIGERPIGRRVIDATNNTVDGSRFKAA
jgi:hypothetical protein